MGDVTYRISYNSCELWFNVSNFTNNITRTLYDMDIPYSKYSLVTDQVSTSYEIAMKGFIKCGSGRKYTSIKNAVAAIEAILTATSGASGGIVEAGSITGTTWATDTNYPHQYVDASPRVLISRISYSHSEGVPNTEGVLDITVNLRIGDIY